MTGLIVASSYRLKVRNQRHHYRVSASASRVRSPLFHESISASFRDRTPRSSTLCCSCECVCVCVFVSESDFRSWNKKPTWMKLMIITNLLGGTLANELTSKLFLCLTHLRPQAPESRGCSVGISESEVVDKPGHLKTRGKKVRTRVKGMQTEPRN